MQVFYQIEEWDQGEEYYDCDTQWSFNFCADIAQDCAEDAHNNHDGWDSSWPLTIAVYEIPYPEGLKGKFEVDREAQPVFYARPVTA